jgi:hypothetical protein
MIAYIDETGDIGASPGSSRHMIVAATVCADARILRNVAKREWNKLRPRQKRIAELKGSNLPPVTMRRLLTDLVNQGIAIYAAVWDKRTYPSIGEELYTLTFAACVQHILGDYPGIAIVADQRYNNPNRQEKFFGDIRLLNQSPDLLLETNTSHRDGALQVADAVAWALHQKYEHEDEDLYGLISSRIQAEFLVCPKQNQR